MKATELRIGNRVFKVDFDQCKEIYRSEYLVRGYDLECLEIDGCLPHNDSELQAIPLTEEWLLKFGFEKRNNYSQNWFLWLDHGWHKGMPYIRFIKKIFYLYITGESPVKICKIRYIHQLQNLYFVLTGDELNEIIALHIQEQPTKEKNLTDEMIRIEAEKWEQKASLRYSAKGYVSDVFIAGCEFARSFYESNPEYYPKEFVEWLHDNTDDTRDMDNYKLWWVNIIGDYFTLDEIFKYWKTNH